MLGVNPVNSTRPGGQTASCFSKVTFYLRAVRRLLRVVRYHLLRIVAHARFSCTRQHGVIRGKGRADPADCDSRFCFQPQPDKVLW